MEFQLSTLTPDLASEASKVLNSFNLEDVRDASTGAAAFYLWVNIIILYFWSKTKIFL